MKNEKWGIVLCVFFSLIMGGSVFSQAISPVFYGQNAWMPDSIGSVFLNGKLNNHWADIRQSGARLIRFGGIAADHHRPTNAQYLKMVDSIRSNGMEPVLQVSYNNNQYTASQAAEVVRFINVVNGRNVKYWIIANEPDNDYGLTSSGQVAPYIRAFSKAMKQIDPGILIIGPELAWYNHPIINGLTTAGGPDDITGKDNNGHYIIDIFSFHTYPFNGTQSRSSVISKLREPNGFYENLATLKNKLKACDIYHKRTGSSTLTIAITEANINYLNSSSDDLHGLGANSFIGGQFWVEMMAIAIEHGVSFMNFWSVIEGNSNANNIGFLERSNGTRKPSYYHFKMMAENFKGSFIPARSSNNYIKSFSSHDGNIINLIVMNQGKNEQELTVNLYDDLIAESGVTINVNASINNAVSFNIPGESTMLFKFNSEGEVIEKLQYRLHGEADQGIGPVKSSDLITGLDNLWKNVSPLEVFPNPMARDHLNIRLGLPENVSELNMEIFSVSGQLVYSRKIEPVNREHQEKIYLEKPLAAGIYIVQVSSSDHHQQVKVLVN